MVSLKVKQSTWNELQTSALHLRDGSVHGQAQLLHHLLDVTFVDDIGWREQDVIAVHAVDGATHGITHETVFHRLFFDLLVQLQTRFEGRLRAPIADEFQASKQAATTNIADVWMISETLVERKVERAEIEVVLPPLSDGAVIRHNPGDS